MEHFNFIDAVAFGGLTQGDILSRYIPVFEGNAKLFESESSLVEYLIDKMTGNVEDGLYVFHTNRVISFEGLVTPEETAKLIGNQDFATYRIASADKITRQENYTRHHRIEVVGGTPEYLKAATVDLDGSQFLDILTIPELYIARHSRIGKASPLLNNELPEYVITSNTVEGAIAVLFESTSIATLLEYNLHESLEFEVFKLTACEMLLNPRQFSKLMPVKYIETAGRWPAKGNLKFEQLDNARAKVTPPIHYAAPFEATLVKDNQPQ